MLTIDGARGEGGGQVLRTALALAAATRTDITVRHIRAPRDPPGLKHGHLAAVRALAEICDGEIAGDTLGSTEVTLRPGVTVGGEYAFAIDTAGPVTLLLQAILPTMVASRQAFSLTLRGGTNVSWAPQWDDLALVHAPLLAKLGVELSPSLVRRGYFPQGRGEARVDVATPALRRVALDEPGAVRRIRGVVSSHGLPRHVMERAVLGVGELRVDAPLDVEQDFHRGPGTGMAVALAVETQHSMLGADAVGKKGLRVEQVVEPAVAALRAEMASGAGVDVHQADQLPVFLALAGGGSFTCRMLSPHATTVLDLLPEFLPVRARTSLVGKLVRVEIERAVSG